MFLINQLPLFFRVFSFSLQFVVGCQVLMHFFLCVVFHFFFFLVMLVLFFFLCNFLLSNGNGGGNPKKKKKLIRTPRQKVNICSFLFLFTFIYFFIFLLYSILASPYLQKFLLPR